MSRLEAATLKTARRRLLDMHYRARVGHLGGNLSCLDILMVLYHEMIGPADRFILSKGHSAGALYVALWSLGLLTDDELDSFHQDSTLLPGHPPTSGIPAIRFATGSLGHGLSLAAGTALAARLNDESRVVYCLTSDGEWQEGSTIEALGFACHHRLGNLVIAVDHNGLQGFGRTSEIAAMEPLAEYLGHFDAAIRCGDGHDPAVLRHLLKPDPGRPVIAILDTIKGRGIPDLERTVASHYLPLTAEQYSTALAHMGAEA